MTQMARFVLVLAMGSALASGVSAQALTGFSGGTVFSTYQADGDTVGWRFSVDRPVNVTHLGFWDGDSATNAMTASHAVGLWDNSGTLLTSNTVNPTSPFTGQFRYEPTTLVTIGPGTFNLGAFYPDTNPLSDGYITSTSGITMASGFTMLNTLRDPDGPQTGLVFPSVTTGPAGRFGPNLLFAEVPEPAAVVLVGWLLVGSLAARHRR